MARGKVIYFNQLKYNTLQLSKFSNFFMQEYKQHGGG